MDKWHVFIDVDGTLVNYHNQLPDSAREAIRQARENGHKIFAVTGRSKAEMPEYITSIGLDGYVGGNGNYIESHGETIMHQALEREVVQEIVDWLHDHKLEFYVEANSGLFGSANFAEVARPVLRLYREGKGIHLEPEDEPVEVFPGMIYGGELVRDDVNKISFILNSYQDYLDAKEHFKDYAVNTWGGHGEHALFGDIARAGITKRTALEYLEDHHQLDRNHTMAFGDANIDIPMLEYAKVGVAMGNGGEGIKEMADYVTDSVDEDGLYNAFKHFGLI